MIKCKAVITETGDLAIEAVDCKLNMIQVACARFAILEKDEQVFNAAKVKELFHQFWQIERGPSSESEAASIVDKIQKELGIE